MKTKVLIPAYNSEKYLANTLNSLPPDLTEPIVAVNGSTDKTAEIAESFGATVYDIEQQGKLPAIQESLRRLGVEALEPMILLDSDTQPTFPRVWHNVMLRALQPENDTPWMVGAPVWFTRNPDSPHSTRASAAVRSIYRQVHGNLIHPQTANHPHGAYYGPNQAIKLTTPEALENVLALDHYWPEEDVAMAKAVTDAGGMFTQLTDNRAIASSPESVSFTPLRDYIDPASVNAKIMAAYRATAAPGSIEYKR